MRARALAGAALMCLLAGGAAAQTLVAAQAIRAQNVIGPEHLAILPETIVGALQHPADAIGLEARVNIYPGRPIRPEDLGQPALVDRNQPVVMVYVAGGLAISAEGRALGRAGLGELLRVMNLDSRNVVLARAIGPGLVEVGQ